MWTLETGLYFVRLYQDQAMHHGFNLSLGGGVLNSGQSWHDLDIVIAPARGCNGENIREYLQALFWSAGLKEVKRSRWNDYMTVIVTTSRTGRKIDLFVVNGAGGVLPPPQWFEQQLENMAKIPPPTMEEVDQQMKASATTV
jgi:hypothetical protein